MQREPNLAQFYSNINLIVPSNGDGRIILRYKFLINLGKLCLCPYLFACKSTMNEHLIVNVLSFTFSISFFFSFLPAYHVYDL